MIFLGKFVTNDKFWGKNRKAVFIVNIQSAFIGALHQLEPYLLSPSTFAFTDDVHAGIILC